MTMFLMFSSLVWLYSLYLIFDMYDPLTLVLSIFGEQRCSSNTAHINKLASASAGYIFDV